LLSYRSRRRSGTWARPCVWAIIPLIWQKGSLAHRIYGTDEIVERHRHRYEVNPSYIQQIEYKGMIFSGTNGT